MKQVKNSMTISELSDLSGIPISTIKFYIRKGIAFKPDKSRGTKAYYNSSHLNRLKLIKKIQTEGNMPLNKIQEVIHLIDEGNNKKPNHNTSLGENMKPDIIRCATDVFRKKGYDKTTIADIVDAVHIGRSTFYKNFKNKKELFIECIKEIIFREMKKSDKDNNVKDENEDETDILKVFDKHAKAYYNVNPLWIDMVNMLRAAAINDPEEFSDKLDEVIQLKINLLKRGIENGIQHGLFRNINPTLATTMLLGMQDYSDYISQGEDKQSFEKEYEEAKDIILYGILNKKP